MKGKKEKGVLRVAAYARVSTDSEDQANSFESQKKYFSELIDGNPEWQLVDIYADKGLSGTSTKKRPAFQRMLYDATVAQKIDLIVTKEVSRFARNTVEAISCLDLLRAHNVAVRFTNEGISSENKGDRFSTGLIALLAEEESNKISIRVNWSMDKLMEAGYVMGRPTFGFFLRKGVLTVNDLEAETVRLIFRLYVYEHLGQRAIAKYLTESGIPTGGYIKKWATQNISGILRNEKYVGDLISKKGYTPNFLDHQRVLNDPEDTIFFADHHEAIIDRKTWTLAQEELQRRKMLIDKSTHYTNRYWASGLVSCGECGGFFVSRTRYNPSGSTTRFWACNEQYAHGKKISEANGKNWGCNSSLINDAALLGCVRYALAKVTLNKAKLIDAISAKLKAVCDSDYESKPILAIDRQLSKAIEKSSRLIDIFLDGTITRAELDQMKARYQQEIESLQKQKNRLEEESKILKSSQEDFSKLMERAEEILTLDDPDGMLYKELLSKVVMHSGHNVDIHIKHIEEPIKLHFRTRGHGSSYRVECAERN